MELSREAYMKGSRTSKYKDDPYQRDHSLPKGKSAGPRNQVSISQVVTGHGSTKDNPMSNYGDLFSNNVMANKSITAKAKGNLPLKIRNSDARYDQRSNSAASTKAITQAVANITGRGSPDREPKDALHGAFITKTLPVTRKQTLV